MTATKNAGAAKQAVKQIRIRDIVVPEDRKRSLQGLDELTASIAALGLLNPIIISRDRRLIAGLHRLRACAALGWKEIPAVVVKLSVLDTELAEIDENLCRAELTVLERGEQTLRRKEIYELRHPETKRGVAGALGLKRTRDPEVQASDLTVASFTEDTAAKTHQRPRRVERAVQIAQKIAPAVRDAVRDTPIADNQGHLLALAQIEDPARQAAAADRLVRGEADSVPEALQHLEEGGHTESEPGATPPRVVRDQVGQEITDPEIAEAFTLMTERDDAVIGFLRQAVRAWGKHFHEELVAAKKLRVVEAKAYMGARNLVEHEVRSHAAQLRLEKPYALCPYCKGAPLPADRRKYCQGCGGGGWVDESTYTSAPPELLVPGTSRKSRARAEVEAEVAHE